MNIFETGFHPPLPGKTRKLVIATPWILWVLSALPLFVLFIEFGGDLGACGKEAYYYAKLYSHFFLYPVTFGLISTALLTYPWLWSVEYLYSHRRARLRNFSIIAVSITLAVVFFASYMEFTGSTSTIWAFSPQTNSADLRTARELIEDRCASHSNLDEEEREKFSQALKKLNSENVQRSWTEISYRIGFVAMTLLFAVLFVTVFVASTSRPEGQDVPFRLFVAALFFATFWMLMRITFLIEKFSLYPYKDDSLLTYNYFIFCVFALLYIYLVSTIWTRLRLSEKLGSIFQALTLVVAVIGLLVSHDSMYMKQVPEMLVSLFGTESSFSTYIAVLLLLLIFHFPYIIDSSVNPKRQRRDDRD